MFWEEEKTREMKKTSLLEKPAKTREHTRSARSLLVGEVEGGGGGRGVSLCSEVDFAV